MDSSQRGRINLPSFNSNKLDENTLMPRQTSEHANTAMYIMERIKTIERGSAALKSPDNLTFRIIANKRYQQDLKILLLYLIILLVMHGNRLKT